MDGKKCITGYLYLFSNVLNYTTKSLLLIYIQIDIFYERTLSIGNMPPPKAPDSIDLRIFRASREPIL